MCKRNAEKASAKLSEDASVASKAVPSATAGTIRKADGKCPLNFTSLFVTKESYSYISDEFHSFHENDLNVLLHLFTTTLGVWGAIQAVLLYFASSSTGLYAVYAYGLAVLLTCPAVTGILHTVALVVMVLIPSPSLTFALFAVAAGYGLQDVAHYLMDEPTYLGAYILKAPFTLVLHCVWLLPLVLDAVQMRNFFLPFLVPRNRVVFTDVDATDAIQVVRDWVGKKCKRSQRNHSYLASSTRSY